MRDAQSYVTPFSVLSVTHEGEHAENLRMFFASIDEQTLQPSEIILVIDGELSPNRKDFIKKVSQHLPIVQIPVEKSSHGVCLNTGLAHCNNDLIVRCDTDDKNLPNRFYELVTTYNKHNVSVCSGPIEEFQSNAKRQIRPVPQGRINEKNWSSFFRSPINHSNCCYSKKAVLAAGGYRGGRMEDFKLWVKMLRQGAEFYNTDKVLLHANAEGLSHRRIGFDYLRAEGRLFILNAPRYYFLGTIPATLSFLIRAPLRFPFARPVLSLFYATVLRQKV